MKPVILSLLFVLLMSAAFAQTEKVTVYCNLSPGLGGLEIDYYNLGNFLPDSIRSAVVIDYKKQFHVRNADISNVFLLMSADGWKLVSFEKHSGTTSYLLSREISMDEPTRRLYLEKIKNSFKK